MSYRNACEVYVIDSDPEDDTVTNEDALDAAFRYDAEVASLQDVYQDKDATVEALIDGLEVADDHPFEGNLLLPLQDPYVECYREIGEPEGCWLGVGGLKNASTRQRINAASALREYVGPEAHIHGFGWGPVDESNPDPFVLAKQIRNQPGLIDSLDYSTPARTLSTPLTNGQEHMSVQAAYAGARLVRDLREVTPYPYDLPVETSEQVSVDHFKGP